MHEIHVGCVSSACAKVEWRSHVMACGKISGTSMNINSFVSIVAFSKFDLRKIVAFVICAGRQVFFITREKTSNIQAFECWENIIKASPKIVIVGAKMRVLVFPEEKYKHE